MEFGVKVSVQGLGFKVSGFFGFPLKAGVALQQSSKRYSGIPQLIVGANPNGYLIIQDNAQTIESHTQLRVLIFHLAFAAWCYDFQFRDRHFDVAWYMKVTKLKGFAVPSHRDGFNTAEYFQL